MSRKFTRSTALALCAGAAASIANAQPTPNEDFGTLPQNTIVSRPIALSGSTFYWYKFTIPAVPAGTSGPGALFLDIRTNQPSGATIIDTEIGLYKANGDFATGAVATSSDDDDGPGTGSALSYGTGCPSRANNGAGSQTAGPIFDGRDGGLTAGDYYLAVIPYNGTFATNFGVVPGSQTGTMNLDILLGSSNDPLPLPTITASAANPTATGAGTPVLFTVTTGVCGPTAAVTIDLSSIGGGSAVALFDNGTNGDVTANNRVFSVVVNVPAGATAGSYSLPVTATNAAGPATTNLSFTVSQPPTVLTADGGGIYTEVEDNDIKARANVVPAMLDNQVVSGNTLGTSTVTPGSGSADNFRIATAPAALGIYKHQLTITTTGTAGHIGTIRGLSQTTGVVNIGTDTALQTGTTTPTRLNQWYGFGKGESIYYRVTGTASTTSSYLSTLTSSTVTPVDIGTFTPGSLVITTIAQGHTSDTDLFIYNSNLEPVPGFQNDDESVAEGGTGATTQSRLTRTFAPGTYYLALSTYNTANNQPSPSTDDFLTADVTDFPNVILNTVNSTASTNLAFSVTDSGGAHPFTANRTTPYEIYWARFVISGGGPVCGTADFDGDGDTGTDADIEAFFACLGGNCCATCFPGGADFNGDGDTGTDADIESFFRVLGGGEC